MAYYFLIRLQVSFNVKVNKSNPLFVQHLKVVPNMCKKQKIPINKIIWNTIQHQVQINIGVRPKGINKDSCMYQIP